MIPFLGFVFISSISKLKYSFRYCIIFLVFPVLE